MGSRHSAKTRAEALRLRRLGVGRRGIGTKLGVPTGTLDDWFRVAGLGNIRKLPPGTEQVINAEMVNAQIADVRAMLARGVPRAEIVEAVYVSVADVKAIAASPNDWATRRGVDYIKSILAESAPTPREVAAMAAEIRRANIEKLVCSGSHAIPVRDSERSAIKFFPCRPGRPGVGAGGE